MYKVVLFFLVMILTGCGTSQLEYESKGISITKAYDVMDQLIMTQHKTWKPDYFVITEKYLGWGYGSVSQGTTSAVVYGNVGLGSASGTIRDASERVYFNQVKSVQLLDWTRKFQQWYVVTLVDQNGKKLKHILRTRNKKDAELMVDAVSQVILNHRDFS